MDDDRDYVLGADDFSDYGNAFNDQSEYDQYDEYYDAEISEEEYYTPFPEMDSVIREAAVGFKVIDYHDEEIFCLGHIDEIPVEHNVHPDLLSSRSMKLMKKLKQCTTTTDIPLQLIDMLEHKRNSNYIIDGINQKKEWRNLFRSPSTTSFKRCSLCDKKKSAPINLPRLMHVSMEDQYNLNIKRHSTVNCRQINSASSTSIPNYFPISTGTRQRYIRNLKQNASMHNYTLKSSVASSPREHKRYTVPIKQISKTSTSAQCDESFKTCDLRTTNSKSVQYNPVGGIPSAGDVILYSNPTRWNNKSPERIYEDVNYYDINSSEGHSDFVGNINTMERTPSNTSFVSSVEDSLEDICVELKFENPKPPSEPCIQHEKDKRSGSISSSKSVVYVTSKPTRQHSSTFNNYLVHRMSIPPSEASIVSSQTDDGSKPSVRPRTKSARGPAPDNSSKVVILYKSPSNVPIKEIFKTKNTSYRFDSDTSSTSSGISQQQPMRRRPPPKAVERVQEVNPLIRCPNRTYGLNAIEQQCKSSPRHQLSRTRVRIQSPSCGERYVREDLARDVEDEFDLTNQDFVEKFLKRNRNN